MPRVSKTAKAAANEPPTDQPVVRERIKRIKRNPEFEIALGARIRTARIAVRMSQGALGEAVGISFQQVQKYELGKDRVAASTLHGIATTLGVHPGSFFDDDMSAPSNSIADIKAVVRLGQRIQRVRDPALVRRLLALADVLAETEDGRVGVDSDGAT